MMSIDLMAQDVRDYYYIIICIINEKCSDQEDNEWYL